MRKFSVLLITVSLLLVGCVGNAESLKNDKSGIPVVLYHHLLHDDENTDKENNMILSIDVFEEHMKYLDDNGYYTATLDELEMYINGELELPEKTVVIQFDDGHKTNYLYAYPILKKYNMKASNFVMTGRLSSEPVQFDPASLQYLSWKEMAEMEDVFEFASHTNHLHRILDSKVSALVGEDKDVIMEDLEISKDLLKTSDFAYPFGAYDENTVGYLDELGFRMAFTINPQHVSINDEPLELGRYMIRRSDSFEKFKGIFED